MLYLIINNPSFYDSASGRNQEIRTYAISDAPMMHVKRYLKEPYLSLTCSLLTKAEERDLEKI